jgi:hypothetical protein
MALKPNSRLELARASQTPQLKKKVGATELHGVIGALVYFLGAPFFPL